MPDEPFNIEDYITDTKLKSAKESIAFDEEVAQLYLFLANKAETEEKLTFKQIAEATTVSLYTIEARLFILLPLGGLEIVREGKRDRHVALKKKEFDQEALKTCEQCLKGEYPDRFPLTGITAEFTRKIHIIKEIMAELEQELGKVIPIEKIYQAAQEKDLTVDETQEVIDGLKRKGDCYNVKEGYIARM